MEDFEFFIGRPKGRSRIVKVLGIGKRGVSMVEDFWRRGNMANVDFGGYGEGDGCGMFFCKNEEDVREFLRVRTEVVVVICDCEEVEKMKEVEDLCKEKDVDVIFLTNNESGKLRNEIVVEDNEQEKYWKFVNEISTISKSGRLMELKKVLGNGSVKWVYIIEDLEKEWRKVLFEIEKYKEIWGEESFILFKGKEMKGKAVMKVLECVCEVAGNDKNVYYCYDEKGEGSKISIYLDNKNN